MITLNHKLLITLFFSLLSFLVVAQDCDEGDDPPCQGGCDPPNSPDSTKVPILHSFDPNDIIGATGYGEDQWVSVKDQLGYTIRFENSPDFATAPAQIVRINLPLDEDLDLTTLQLSDFGFGQFIFNIPTRKAFYSTRLDVRDSLNIFVDITAGIDVVKREVFWIFESIDPITGLPPEDALTGFLPVNDTTVTIYTDTITQQGEGFVSFNILPKTTAMTGDTVREQASIVFDINAPIETNIWTNVIDAFPPESDLDELAPMTAENFVWLNWEGKDDEGGVGIDHYNLYVSKNDQPFYLFAENIDTTAYQFTGDLGAKYAFYTTAVDLVGNEEAAKEEGDTYTVFQEPSSIAIIAPNSERFCAGDPMQISWALSNDNLVNIEISTNKGISYTAIVQNINPTNQVYNWTIPDGFSCTDCTIRITEAGGGLEGTSGTFLINPQPNLSFTDLPTNFCETETAITLAATPIGGTFSGEGVTENQWLPSNVGTYDIAYTYMAESGCTATLTQALEVLPAPIADFNFTLNGSTLTFQDASRHNANQWLWQFGDNTSSTLQNPIHNFEPGTYNVCLTVESDCGSNTKCDSIIAGILPCLLYTSPSPRD